MLLKKQIQPKQIQQKSNYQISKKLQKTYHIFKRNGRYKLKQTYWYEMQSNFDGIPEGQAEEGIEKDKESAV